MRSREASLPPGIFLAYDGLEISVPSLSVPAE